MSTIQEVIIRRAIRTYQEYRIFFTKKGHNSEIYLMYINILDQLECDHYIKDIIRNLIDRQLDENEDPEKLIRRIDHVMNVIRSEDV